jgi:hypothetical protein
MLHVANLPFPGIVSKGYELLGRKVGENALDYQLRGRPSPPSESFAVPFEKLGYLNGASLERSNSHIDMIPTKAFGCVLKVAFELGWVSRGDFRRRRRAKSHAHEDRWVDGVSDSHGPATTPVPTGRLHAAR